MKNTKSINLNHLSHPIDQSRFIMVIIFSWIIKLFFKKVNAKLPLRIGRYTFQKSLSKTGTVKDFTIGLYEDQNGQKALAKMWTGKFKNPTYYTLLNEIIVTEVLTKVIKRLEKTMPSEYSHIHIPKFIQKQETANSLIILTEFIEGKIATSIPSRRRIDIYLECVKFIQYIGSQMTTREKQLLSIRKPISFIIIYPLLLLKAAITHPRIIPDLLKSIPIFLRCIPILTKQKKIVLVHRDLHVNNILISKGKVGIIDFQLCLFSFELSEFVTTLRYLWKTDDFYIYILQAIKEKYGHQNEFETLLRGLIVHSATHGLTGRNFTTAIINRWIDFLRFGQEPYFLKLWDKGRRGSDNNYRIVYNNKIK